jgi:Fur family ferric uptake transcriptional regulator
MAGEQKDQWFWDTWQRFLARKALKHTNQRLQVIKNFLKLNRHVDADTLYDSLRKAGHTVGLATIYRTLNLLKEAGLVEQRLFADGRATFELLVPHLHHDHLICTACGTIVEFENKEIERLQAQVADQYGYTLSSHRLELYGLCATCMASQ